MVQPRYDKLRLCSEILVQNYLYRQHTTRIKITVAMSVKVYFSGDLFHTEPLEAQLGSSLARVSESKARHYNISSKTYWTAQIGLGTTLHLLWPSL